MGESLTKNQIRIQKFVLYDLLTSLHFSLNLIKVINLFKIFLAFFRNNFFFKLYHKEIRKIAEVK